MKSLVFGLDFITSCMTLADLTKRVFLLQVTISLMVDYDITSLRQNFMQNFKEIDYSPVRGRSTSGGKPVFAPAP